MISVSVTAAEKDHLANWNLSETGCAQRWRKNAWMIWHYWAPNMIFCHKPTSTMSSMAFPKTKLVKFQVYF